MAEQRPRDTGTELGRFLRARRTQLSPADVGFTATTGIRRTPELRREEVAALAGVSIDYYTRLERGKETRPSPAVVDALARALTLDPDEHEHLIDLAAHAARQAPQPPPTPSRTVAPKIKLVLETLRPNPAYITSRTLDMLDRHRSQVCWHEPFLCRLGVCRGRSMGKRRYLGRCRPESPKLRETGGSSTSSRIRQGRLSCPSLRPAIPVWCRWGWIPPVPASRASTTRR
ncbi:helix-turn-helix domain-containing protein [Nocardia sp. NPDC020380]|uniref:helix-turn-helix domain-containing protein n=1 Tax=Nocardia sp. NPDC020380 TaxID=3364309 RepID=UPI00379D41C9